ncbi:AMP-binding protein [Microbacterium sp. CJ88]|uniref:AMP-binding protein n=1 Tax=Microbacterium sp. CJ88 TaxID=3445672 RepID=UPI003F657BF4
MLLIDLPDTRARADASAPCLRDDAGVLTNADFAERVRAAAGALAGAGVARGDVVGVKLSNRVELIVVLFAAWRLGAVLTPVNPALGPAETAYQLHDARAMLLVAETADEAPDGIAPLTVADLAAQHLGDRRADRG